MRERQRERDILFNGDFFAFIFEISTCTISKLVVVVVVNS